MTVNVPFNHIAIALRRKRAEPVSIPDVLDLAINLLLPLLIVAVVGVPGRRDGGAEARDAGRNSVNLAAESAEAAGLGDVLLVVRGRDGGVDRAGARRGDRRGVVVSEGVGVGRVGDGDTHGECGGLFERC